jgi:hypothetical protein
MQVGDLVRLKHYPKAPIGLIVSIERRGVFGDRWEVKVQWLDGNKYQYCNMNGLEVVSESR